jgi:hypothetical protein
VELVLHSYAGPSPLRGGSGKSKQPLGGWLIEVVGPAHAGADPARGAKTDLIFGAGEGVRTLDPNLGKVVLYH